MEYQTRHAINNSLAEIASAAPQREHKGATGEDGLQGPPSVHVALRRCKVPRGHFLRHCGIHEGSRKKKKRWIKAGEEMDEEQPRGGGRWNEGVEKEWEEVVVG